VCFYCIIHCLFICLLQKANFLKRKITDAGARNVKRTRSSNFPVANTFARYSSKLFSTVIGGLSPRQVRVLQSYGASCSPQVCEDSGAT
uniref:Uncharacterized protein n=1 Tax=Aegilops tauschii subsp. strangulata TaxID=200361 RepID=A0A453C7Y3_AEGTS